MEFSLVVLLLLMGTVAGYFFQLLTLSGSIAAFFVGVFTLFGFSIKGLILLLLFFLTSSFWSFFKKKKKRKIDEQLAKGSRRDYAQVLANGGGATLCSLLYLVFPHDFWIVAFSIFLATANSDTWASEIGPLSRKPPFHIRTRTKVLAGSSGAVSLLGTWAALLGSFLIAASSTYLFQLDWSLLLFIFVFGFIGNIFDTFLGAYVQVIYFCKKCGMSTERTIHCEEKTVIERGFPFMNNEIVNFSAGFFAFLLSAVFYYAYFLQ